MSGLRSGSSGPARSLRRMCERHARTWRSHRTTVEAQLRPNSHAQELRDLLPGVESRLKSGSAQSVA